MRRFAARRRRALWRSIQMPRPTPCMGHRSAAKGRAGPGRGEPDWTGERRAEQRRTGWLSGAAPSGHSRAKLTGGAFYEPCGRVTFGWQDWVGWARCLSVLPRPLLLSLGPGRSVLARAGTLRAVAATHESAAPSLRRRRRHLH